MEYFNNSIRTIFDRHAPHIERKLKGKPCPWLTHETKQLMNRRDQIHRRAKKHNTKEDWELYKRLRNSVNNQMKRNKSTYHHDLLDENKLNPAKFWNIIKTLFPTKVNMKQSTMDTNTDNQSKANVFCNYFTNIVKTLKQYAIPLVDFTWKPANFIPMRTVRMFKFEYVSKIFVEKQIKKFRRKKATGADELPTSMLKDCASIISKPLSHIINISINTGTVPIIWKTARITPVFKSGT